MADEKSIFDDISVFDGLGVPMPGSKKDTELTRYAGKLAKRLAEKYAKEFNNEFITRYQDSFMIGGAKHTSEYYNEQFKNRLAKNIEQMIPEMLDDNQIDFIDEQARKLSDLMYKSETSDMSRSIGNPSMAVTGRNGRNVSEFNKKLETQMNKAREANESINRFIENTRKNIIRVSEAYIDKQKKKAEAAGKVANNQSFSWGELIKDPVDDRIRLKMNEKPGVELTDYFRHHGWKYSPKNSAWQRQWTQNAENDLKNISNKFNGELTGLSDYISQSTNIEKVDPKIHSTNPASSQVSVDDAYAIAQKMAEIAKLEAEIAAEEAAAVAEDEAWKQYIKNLASCVETYGDMEVLVPDADPADLPFPPAIYTNDDGIEFFIDMESSTNWTQETSIDASRGRAKVPDGLIEHFNKRLMPKHRLLDPKYNHIMNKQEQEKERGYSLGLLKMILGDDAFKPNKYGSTFLRPKNVRGRDAELEKRLEILRQYSDVFTGEFEMDLWGIERETLSEMIDLSEDDYKYSLDIERAEDEYLKGNFGTNIEDLNAQLQIAKSLNMISNSRDNLGGGLFKILIPFKLSETEKKDSRLFVNRPDISIATKFAGHLYNRLKSVGSSVDRSDFEYIIKNSNNVDELESYIEKYRKPKKLPNKLLKLLNSGSLTGAYTGKGYARSLAIGRMSLDDIERDIKKRLDDEENKLPRYNEYNEIDEYAAPIISSNDDEFNSGNTEEYEDVDVIDEYNQEMDAALRRQREGRRWLAEKERKKAEGKRRAAEIQEQKKLISELIGTLKAYTPTKKQIEEDEEWEFYNLEKEEAEKAEREQDRKAANDYFNDRDKNRADFYKRWRRDKKLKRIAEDSSTDTLKGIFKALGIPIPDKLFEADKSYRRAQEDLDELKTYAKGREFTKEEQAEADRLEEILTKNKGAHDLLEKVLPKEVRDRFTDMLKDTGKALKDETLPAFIKFLPIIVKVGATLGIVSAAFKKMDNAGAEAAERINEVQKSLRGFGVVLNTDTQYINAMENQIAVSKANADKYWDDFWDTGAHAGNLAIKAWFADAGEEIAKWFSQFEGFFGGFQDTGADAYDKDPYFSGYIDLLRSKGYDQYFTDEQLLNLFSTVANPMIESGVGLESAAGVAVGMFDKYFRSGSYTTSNMTYEQVLADVQSMSELMMDGGANADLGLNVSEDVMKGYAAKQFGVMWGTLNENQKVWMQTEFMRRQFESTDREALQEEIRLYKELGLAIGDAAGQLYSFDQVEVMSTQNPNLPEYEHWVDAIYGSVDDVTESLNDMLTDTVDAAAQASEKVSNIMVEGFSRGAARLTPIFTQITEEIGSIGDIDYQKLRSEYADTERMTYNTSDWHNVNVEKTPKESDSNQVSQINNNIYLQEPVVTDNESFLDKLADMLINVFNEKYKYMSEYHMYRTN